MVLLPVANMQVGGRCMRSGRGVHASRTVGVGPVPVHARSQSRLGVQAGSCSPSTHNVRLPLGLWVQERGGNDDYSSLVAAGRAAVLATLAAAGLGDLQRHIVQEEVIEPIEWAAR